MKNLHSRLGFDRRLAAIARDSRVSVNGVALIRYLEGLRGGGFHAPEMFEVISHPKLMAAVGALLGTKEIVASSVYRVRPKLPKLGRGDVPWHQDSGYYAAHCDQQLIITCWVPLVDATVENGCMQILPRTHRGQVATHHTGGNAGFLVIKDENLPDDPRRAITAACPRGGVIFMTNRTPHCSTPNYSDSGRPAGALTCVSSPLTRRAMSASGPRPSTPRATRTRNFTRRATSPAIRPRRTSW